MIWKTRCALWRHQPRSAQRALLDGTGRVPLFFSIREINHVNMWLCIITSDCLCLGVVSFWCADQFWAKVFTKTVIESSCIPAKWNEIPFPSFKRSYIRYGLDLCICTGCKTSCLKVSTPWRTTAVGPAEACKSCGSQEKIERLVFLIHPGPIQL